MIPTMLNIFSFSLHVFTALVLAVFLWRTPKLGTSHKIKTHLPASVRINLNKLPHSLSEEYKVYASRDSLKNTRHIPQ
ncbi:hypothetical protein F4819DRAFT_478896 [Hypoxylon fuscum]|nr:hypothetical protein F4819DRAFT_478896 [Hypoxylon fuscum]